jgi:hypothetical protein
MVHDKRVFRVKHYDESQLDELAQKIRGTTWTLCTGFEFGGVMFLNDSFSEDGAQEYAAIIPDKTNPQVGIQVESITFGWVREVAQAAQYIRDCVHYVDHMEEAPVQKAVALHIEHPEGSCALCQ